MYIGDVERIFFEHNGPRVIAKYLLAFHVILMDAVMKGPDTVSVIRIFGCDYTSTL